MEKLSPKDAAEIVRSLRWRLKQVVPENKVPVVEKAVIAWASSCLTETGQAEQALISAAGLKWVEGPMGEIKLERESA